MSNELEVAGRKIRINFSLKRTWII